MSLLSLAIVIIVVGLLLWAVNQYIPMDGRIKQILNIVVIIVLVLYILQALGVLPNLINIRLK